MADIRDPGRLEKAFLSAQALDEGDLAQAYVLVRLCNDGISMERWRDAVAQSACCQGPMWQSVRDPRGYIHALFAHRREQDLEAGRVLVVTDILTAGPAWRAALEAIDAAARAAAREAACASIRIMVHPHREAPGSERLRGAFRACGYRDCGPYLSLSAPLAMGGPGS